MKKLVVIPLYNEEGTIKAVLEKLCSVYSDDVLVVDDGSSDRSLDILKELVCSKIKVISHEHNRGYGQTLIDGFNFAIAEDYDRIVTMDCDLQHEPEMVPQFFAELDDADIVSGSRYYSDSQTDSEPPPDRHKINKEICELLKRETSYDLTDAFCGFKGYRVEALKKLNLQEPGYSMPLQLWVQANRVGLSVKEIPVARIYFNVKRSFGGGLDDPEKRLKYYKETLKREFT